MTRKFFEGDAQDLAPSANDEHVAHPALREDDSLVCESTVLALGDEGGPGTPPREGELLLMAHASVSYAACDADDLPVLFQEDNPGAAFDAADLRAPSDDFCAETARARELSRLLIEHIAAMEASGFEFHLDGFALCVAPDAEVAEDEALDGDWSYKTSNDPHLAP